MSQTTALTNTSGVATISLTPASVTSAGAATITAKAQVGTDAVTGSMGYSVGASSLTISAPIIGVSPTFIGSSATSPLSAFGNTSITVTVSSNGTPVATPQVVTFSSPCATSGKAKLSASVNTVNGVAVGSYSDNGCAGSDLVTVSVSGIASSSATVYTTAPSTGALKFISANPTTISLKGTGGVSTSLVTFEVVDGAGNALSGKVVTFGLSTVAGGITTTPAIPATATSDGNGLVTIGVNAGTVSTPVRVTASTPGAVAGTTLSTQSSVLTITTGIPTQTSFSLAATLLNIEGWGHDGVTSVLTARLADHFSNPVPDGTAINFISEGASVVGSCTTKDGACSATFTSQNARPSDGRVTVLAYAVGEESFVDLNGNGVADKSPNELVDLSGNSTDMPEAWVDYNENGVFDPASEPYIDFNNDHIYNAGDTLFNGVLCDNVTPPPTGSSAGTCSPNKTIDVRGEMVIVLSGSLPYVTTNIAALGLPTTIYDPVTNTLDLQNCGAPHTFYVRIVDVNGNLMPAGTAVSFAANGDGTIVATGGSFPVPNGNPPIADLVGFAPVDYSALYSVTVQGDGTTNSFGGCTDSTPHGTLTVTTRTPLNQSTTVTIVNLKN